MQFSFVKSQTKLEKNNINNKKEEKQKEVEAIRSRRLTCKHGSPRPPWLPLSLVHPHTSLHGNSLLPSHFSDQNRGILPDSLVLVPLLQLLSESCPICLDKHLLAAWPPSLVESPSQFSALAPLPGHPWQLLSLPPFTEPAYSPFSTHQVGSSFWD